MLNTRRQPRTAAAAWLLGFVCLANTIDWLTGGVEPAIGTTYTARWTYTRQMVKNTDYVDGGWFGAPGYPPAGDHYYIVLAFKMDWNAVEQEGELRDIFYDEKEIRGRLRWLSPGIPMLEVPPEDILAVGTTDYLADAALQARLAAELAGRPQPPASQGPWDLISAEVFTFDDPETRMPPLDRLEGFRPGGGSLYRRVLVGAGHSRLWLYAS